MLLLQFKSMNIKHKINKNRENEQHNNRYTLNSNYESTPALTKGWHSINLNKENNQNVNNFHLAPKEEQKFGFYEAVKSSEFPKRLRTSANELDLGQFKKNKNKNNQEGLVNSQEFVRFRQKQTTEPQEEEYYRGEHMTFGVAGRTGLLTSREFLEDKRMKNEVIDEIMAINKRGLCKSFNEFSLGSGHCVNHPSKKVNVSIFRQNIDYWHSLAKERKKCSIAPNAPSIFYNKTSKLRNSKMSLKDSAVR